MKNKKALKGSLWNLAGMLFPLLAGIYSIPRIIRLWGEHEAGLLMLIWGLIGYFTLFDFGLGRAITQRMAVHYENKNRQGAEKTAVTAMLILALIGSLSGLMLWFLTPAIGGHWLRDSSLLTDEIEKSVHYVALAMPFVIVSVGLRGILEAQNRFLESNLIRLPLGVWTFVSPVISANYGAGFSEMILVLMCARAVSMVIYLVLVRDVLRSGEWSRSEYDFLIGFGGWMTISNIVSPIMTQMDRYVIAYLVAASAVAYYVTPYEIVMRVQLIATAVTAAYLPLFSGLQGNREDLYKSYQEAGRFVYWPTFLAAGFLYLFADEILSIWIGPEFSKNSVIAMKILCVGIVFNSQALVPYTLLQAVVKPRWIAINHLVELPIYLLLLWFATVNFGLMGAALASTIRVICDYMVLQWQSGRLIARKTESSWWSIDAMVVLGMALIIGVDYCVSNFVLKVIIFFVVLVFGVSKIYSHVKPNRFKAAI